MIHAVRKMARGLRRRPAWQVIGAYAPTAWLVWVLVARLTEITGLPSWTPTMALALLVVMAPVVVATAVTQRGLEMYDEVDPEDQLGRTPDQVLVVPEAHPLRRSSLFTWQNAFLVGLSCVVLFVTSVVAYMSMWALGIGPVGSLLAQGVIAEHDPVILAGFENHTDDASLGAFATDAFELELARTPVVSIVDTVRIREVAVEMGADPAGPLTSPVARRVAEQAGTKLVLGGDVVRDGAGYLLTATISRPSGAVLARFEESCPDETELLVALERLAERVRERMGESLRSIREGRRLAPIASTSDEALRLFNRAGRAAWAGEVGGAIDLLEQAVEADPSFALAWRRLGLLSEQVGDRPRARAAYGMVIELWAPGGAADDTVARMRGRLAALE